ncbi:hypothetical protein FDJ32_gp32 [Pseudomonas phage NV1]|uniref:Uncharacterized protein n=1 Tax=Pseudomonas phage NV1 TaxID=2079543 RepID=A0A2L0HPR2_9CAUD|nr:hypothetical protein FDJ32_gp32 [Pseudomonas phage NV1]AUX83661.1 hypothetical protein NV1_p32 [Pseudomonas phage NV1]
MLSPKQLMIGKEKNMASRALTAGEWMDLGYIIRTGERSHCRNARGRALFFRDQVRVRHYAVAPRGQWVFVPYN